MQISPEILKTWTTATHFEDGKRWHAAGRVTHVQAQDGHFEGRITVHDRAQICRFTLNAAGEVRNECPCRVNRQEGLICGHVIALALAWYADHADPLEERRLRVEKRIEHWAKVPHPGYIKRGPSGAPARLRLSLRKTWQQDVDRNEVVLIPEIEVNARWQRPDKLPPGQVLRLSVDDERLLFLLEDIHDGPLTAVFPVTTVDFLQILQWRRPGDLHVSGWGGKIRLQEQALSPLLSVELDPGTGELLVRQTVDLPRKSGIGVSPFFVMAGGKGWVFAGEDAWPLEAVPPPELDALHHGLVRIPRERVFRFLHQELPRLEAAMLVDNRVDPGLFRHSPVRPSFRLLLKGGEHIVTGTLFACYGDQQVLCGGGELPHPVGVPDPSDPLAYGGRHLEAEQSALARLQQLGFAARSGDQLGSLSQKAAILNLLAALRYELEPEGWSAELNAPLQQFAEHTALLLAQVTMEATDAPEWFRFDLRLRDSAGGRYTEAQLRHALERGEHFLERDGRVLLIPEAQARLLLHAAAEAEAAPDGSLRVRHAKCGYLDSLFHATRDLPVNAPPRWQALAQEQNQEVELEAVELPETLRGVLRPYQDLGVRWLRFLERAGYNGILADDMGLGKTLQALAWLSLPRVRDEARGNPALVVCPTSLVQNWAEEAKRFTPGCRVCVLHGSGRDAKWEEADSADLVVTSYAILRRDVQRIREVSWSAVVLDEAQHIKNPGTQNAKAAKLLRSDQRLVLTGTPVENGVRDLWSMMDFLMPGYLGTHAQFGKRFEAPIRSGGPGASSALHLLRTKMRPFLLRRLKQQVAKDLPPRLQRPLYCDMLPAQRDLYDALEAEVKAEAERAVRDLGFARARMNVLQGLLRLRQVCCHPGLLPDPSLSEIPSGKMEMFLEVLDEIMDGGHRVLVFSQFVRMLHRLRSALEERQIPYAYLDGATTERQEEVRRFNDSPEIPVFLISLMAGGTGLNLTGADVVIHFDPWWNPAIEDQATDRAHRIGQEKTVYAMKLITRNSIEARVVALQDAKREVMNAALENDEAVMDRLGWDDVRALLEL